MKTPTRKENHRISTRKTEEDDMRMIKLKKGVVMT